MIQNEKNYLIHYGTKNSGRYPRGSGERPHQHDGLRSAFRKKRKNAQSTRTATKIKTINGEVRGKYRHLSDDQLDKIINRLRKEKEFEKAYAELNMGNQKEKKKLEMGKKISTSIINGVAGGVSGYISKSISNQTDIQKQKRLNTLAVNRQKQMNEVATDQLRRTNEINFQNKAREQKLFGNNNSNKKKGK